MEVILVVLIALSSEVVAPKEFKAPEYRHEATPHSIPSQVFVEVYGAYKGWYCGGSLISQNYVLTSAACCRGTDLEFHVRLGVHRPFEDEDTQILVVSDECKVHENYSWGESVNDVAVIKLPELVTLTPAMQPIALPSRADVNNTFEFYTGRISGWAITYNFGERTISDVLNYIDAVVISNNECRQLIQLVGSSVLCTDRGRYSGGCSGNAGSPLIVDSVQIGIVSSVIRYCGPDNPAKFARITSFLDWLEQHTDVVIS